jgi:hypothetical protein
MPPARRSATKKPAAGAGNATKGVRARAASSRAATRREVEQAIKRFEKRLDDANDALKTLGSHLGRGAQGSYKEVTAAMTKLRSEAQKTNKQALKDFDKLRSAVSGKAPAAAKSNSGSKASAGAAKRSGSSKSSARTTASKSTARKSTARKSTARKSTSSRSTTSGSTTSRAKTS